jgi:hypothetical protein
VSSQVGYRFTMSHDAVGTKKQAAKSHDRHATTSGEDKSGTGEQDGGPMPPPERPGSQLCLVGGGA